MKGLQTKHQAQYSFKKSSRQERTTPDTCSTRIKEFTHCSGRYPRFLCDGISSHGYNSIRHQFSQSMTRGVPNFSITPLRRNILISASEPRGEGGGEWRKNHGETHPPKKSIEFENVPSIPTLTWPCTLYNMHCSVTLAED